MKSRTAIVALAAGLAAGNAASAEELVIGMQGGDWVTANMEAYVKPFEEATGIKVVVASGGPGMAQLKLWSETGTPEVDLMNLPAPDMLLSCRDGLLEKIDYSIYAAEELDGMDKVAKAECGVGSLIYSTNMTYWAEDFPGDKPKTWADYWDAAKFPGDRMMVGGDYGYGPWDFALLADGVPMDKLYPLDIDRAFAKMEELKPIVRRWTVLGAENQQVFADHEVALGAGFNGRVYNLQKQGMPITTEWNQGRMEIEFWAIPKGAANAAAAQKFVEFATRGAQQAVFVQHIAFAPTNQNAYKSIPAELAANLPTAPDNVKKQFFRNFEWETEAGPDGKSNLEKLTERWNAFIAE